MNIKDKSELILTLSCPDTSGIVAEVASFMANNNLTIKESNQFGDSETNFFFMRVKALSIGDNNIDFDAIKNSFKPIANKRNMHFNIFDTGETPKIIILVSKFDHCLVDLLYRVKNGELKVDVQAIISNHSDAHGLAKSYNIPFHKITVTKENKQEAEVEIENLIHKYDVEVIILARYMQILSKAMSDKFNSRIINIHHSFLPSFKGASPYKQAHKRGVKLIGATAHFVTSDLDEGPIIEQDVTRVTHITSSSDMIAAGRDVERIVLFRAVKYYIERRILLNKHKTVVFN
ncbi:MAG: formyltetrahydrofolate deformylase [Pelagibacterales bacterium]|nr:formyltetrahydrofolate deformylase [Pelagibacterales bacterium]PPR16040.1 MAG: Formyltetrahydrofolate deformylase [Alphaproteobacteria bacterium MarineAlpha9_Bin3]|tara:strand:+ start:25829 stop:26698 length:870 start_codon:yes stop_codon:yes gene_type:complete